MYTTKKFGKQQSGQAEIFPLSPVGKKSIDLRFAGQDLSSQARTPLESR